MLYNTQNSHVYLLDMTIFVTVINLKPNHMKITAIEFSKDDLTAISNYLVSKFVEEDKKQEVDFYLSDIKKIHRHNKSEVVLIGLNEPERFEYLKSENYFPDCYAELIDATAELTLYLDSETDESTNHTFITDRSCKFKITFFYDGEEIKENADDLYEMIENYYYI